MTYQRREFSPSVLAGMPISSETFAHRLIELGERHALTQDERADRIGISRRQYKRWEQGKATPRMPNVRKVAAAYNITADEFLADIGAEDGSLIARLARLEAGLAQLHEGQEALAAQIARLPEELLDALETQTTAQASGAKDPRRRAS